MPRIDFMISRHNDLYADGNYIARFASEAAAANMAVRFAQDHGALYSVLYERRA